MLVATVESTVLATVAYDEARQLLQLEFCGKSTYQYFGVPARVHEALLGARSKGGFFNQAIRGHFPFRLVVPLNTGRPDGEVPARRCW
jgi:hypothetical protein